MDPILEQARCFDIPVIEDVAQAIGARYPSRDGLRAAGSRGFTGCFSFFPSKNLGGIGDGGMVVTNDRALDEKLSSLRDHGARHDAQSSSGRTSLAKRSSWETWSASGPTVSRITWRRPARQ